MVPSTRRINFNRTMDDPAEYQRFRLFAASCFCSELTAFVDEYQLLKARTLSHFGLLQTNGAGFTIPRHQNSPPSTPSTLAATDSDGIDDDSEQRHRRLRMSRCMVDNALTQSMEFMSSALTTSITVSILETVVAAFPDQNSGSGMEQFPADMFDKLDMIRREFVDPRSFTSVNASPLTVKRFMERMESKDLSLTLLDEFKSEVLFMLYTDVYMRYVKKE
ncbi:hypothetical protein GGI02_004351 [Coemansia sp. RSA 2322]|nr:hypothetical protein GGI02_004351 [Coemansia sp. RSA 2322]KAJ2484228.1 hypothetical protein EV174_002595 [Coemansia sp. RSA 2320]